jgi:hypothetical protein
VNFLQVILERKMVTVPNGVFSIENAESLSRKKYRKTIINRDYHQIAIAYFQIENLRLYRSYATFF